MPICAQNHPNHGIMPGEIRDNTRVTNMMLSALPANGQSYQEERLADAMDQAALAFIR
jgi:hypothetical protein